MAFQVVVCSKCKRPRAVQDCKRTRCPCGVATSLASRKALWTGDDGREAAAAVAEIAADGRPALMTGDIVEFQVRSLPRGTTARAEAVARTLLEAGLCFEDDLLAAMDRASIDAERGVQELRRLMVQDIIYEPRSGWYALL